MRFSSSDPFLVTDLAMPTETSVLDLAIPSRSSFVAVDPLGFEGPLRLAAEVCLALRLLQRVTHERRRSAAPE